MLFIDRMFVFVENLKIHYNKEEGKGRGYGRKTRAKSKKGRIGAGGEGRSTWD